MNPTPLAIRPVPAAGMALLLLAGCLGPDPEPPPEPGTLAYAQAAVQQGEAELRALLACLSESALMRSQRAVAAAQRVAIRRGRVVPGGLPGGVLALDPAALPALEYQAEASGPAPASGWVFQLYRPLDTGTTLATPWQRFGSATSRPGPDDAVHLELEAEADRIAWSGRASLVFRTPGLASSGPSAWSLAAQGRCQAPDIDLALEVDDHFQRLTDTSTRQRGLTASSASGRILYSARTFTSLRFADSDHTGSLEIVRAPYRLRFTIDGIRGQVAMNRLNLEGDGAQLAIGRCAGQPCLQFNGEPLEGPVAAQLLALANAVAAWSVSGGGYPVLVDALLQITEVPAPGG